MIEHKKADVDAAIDKLLIALAVVCLVALVALVWRGLGWPG